MDDANAMLEIMEACYNAGGRGLEAVPGGAVCDAIKIMQETHSDYVVTGSTFPGPDDPKIDELIDVEAKIIFAHGMVADKMDERLNKLVEEIESRGVIPGIALHNPVPTLQYAIEKLPQVKAFLTPLNANGLYMGDKTALEEMVDNTKNKWFVGMKTLAAGKLDPKEAYEYISKHNICAVTIGMVTIEEAELSTKIALQYLKK
ncbi:MAG: hypothetical protein EU532_00255 [Promethearchaeota archaeon]|nr:MAG: hypothetical protein EU532_00255 [Candidatus Lokiarchaeota archaeon]